MNKGLEALNQLKHYNTIANDDFDMTHEIDIIETELKRLEEKEHNLKVEMKVNAGLVRRLARITKEKEKQDEILRIIKRSPLDVFSTLELYKDWEDYKEDCDYEDCSTFPFENKEEFDLLKEWLK